MTDTDFSDSHIFLNNKLCEKAHFQTPVESLAVYEVLKVVSGIPLFYEDHIKRLNNSIKLAHIEYFIISESLFIDQIKTLCKANNAYFGNVELRVSKLADNSIQSFIGFIPSSYPQPVSYIEGVKLALFKAERENPNAKVKNTQTRISANKLIADKNVFEVLLVNDEDFITEGSRSNVFFIQGNTVYSAPLEYILPGITRKYAIKALEKINVSMAEKLVNKNELHTLDAAFLCGTSLGILPIKQIDNWVFDLQNKWLRGAMFEYNVIVQAYLSENS